MPEAMKTIAAQDRMGNQFPLAVPESKADQFIMQGVIIALYAGPEWIEPEEGAALTTDEGEPA